jgi:thiol-disulfide isomerase/thioredoxin
MKRIFTLLFLVSTFAIYAQEVPRQKVVVEVGTGTWCPSCPAVVHIIDDLIADGAEISVVEYHINDSYQNAASVLRKDYYGFPWYPTTYYDGRHIGYDDWATYSVHKDYYDASIAEQTSFSLSLNGEVGSDAVTGSVMIDKVANFSGTNMKLHIALTESNIPDNWHGETEVDFAERAMFPDGNGTAIDFASGSNQEVSFSIPLDPNWVLENCELVFFLQDDDTKMIAQGDSVMLDNVTLSNGDFSAGDNISYFYPNPIKSELFLYAKDFSAITEISISDMLGRQVLGQQEYNGAINIENLPAGVYLASYTENQERKTQKIIKE